MKRLRRDEGFTLLEVLMAMVLMLIVLGATLTSLNSYQRRAKLDSVRVASQESLRNAMDHLQRQLVNLATPSTTVKSIYAATDYDLIFQTADPQKRWVRYCVNPADPLIATGKASLWYQVVSGTPGNTPPAAATCPASAGWTVANVGTSVVNTRDGLLRPVFTFNWPKDGAGNDDKSDTSKLTRVRTTLWVDTNPGANPPEQRLISGVYLRNQNQAPVPSFSASDKGTDSTGKHHILLNASATTDFEGRRLDYYWYYGASPPILPSPNPPCTPDPAFVNTATTGYLGRGPVLDGALPALATSPKSVTLCVVDPGDLVATLIQTVTFS